MEHAVSDIGYCKHAFERFNGIGSLPEGGVTRLGYTHTEDLMHEAFKDLGQELGCISLTDEVGNTYILNDAAATASAAKSPADTQVVNAQSDTADGPGYILIGSHLDSVIEGGRFDGVAGIVAGLMIIRWAQRDGLPIPLRVGAFRCEESSNFGRCTIGSGLITHEVYKQDIGHLAAKDGETLEQIFWRRGLSLRPKKISGVSKYLELHIEQGKVLEETGMHVGIVGTIAGPKRFRLHLEGMAEHSGATPMNMRNDALCAAAEIILEIEKMGRREAPFKSVATVGVIENSPDAMNVIPGRVDLGIDIRGIDRDSLARMELDLLASVERICDERGIAHSEEKISDIPPISLSSDVEDGLERASTDLGISSLRMPSGAGHDAMSFADICPSGMVFIPCLKGISHNPAEYASEESVCDGARVLYEYLKGEAR
jgi:beta-ureidopropionase / N-carbamoyl-L-amino-acid hydrolase